ncbi:hypothetical protein CsSME_00032392 [Camellia sinensis var. sinensis]
MGDLILVKSGAGVQQCLSFKDAELDIFHDTYVQSGCECQSESDNMKNLMFPGMSEELMHQASPIRGTLVKEGLLIEILGNMLRKNWQGSEHGYPINSLHEENLQYDNKQYTMQY